MSDNIQRDVNRLEKETKKNLMKLKKGKHNVLLNGEENSKQQYILAADKDWKATWSLSAQQAEHEPAIFPCSSEGKQPSILHYEDGCQ